jgi:hypothetical protein
VLFRCAFCALSKVVAVFCYLHNHAVGASGDSQTRRLSIFFHSSFPFAFPSAVRLSEDAICGADMGCCFLLNDLFVIWKTNF